MNKGHFLQEDVPFLFGQFFLSLTFLTTRRSGPEVLTAFFA
jgi:hypothetical protein